MLWKHLKAFALWVGSAGCTCFVTDVGLRFTRLQNLSWHCHP
jgi:hypothetical protein